MQMFTPVDKVVLEIILISKYRTKLTKVDKRNTKSTDTYIQGSICLCKLIVDEKNS